MAGKLVLVVGRSFSLLPTWSFLQRCLSVVTAWQLTSPERVIYENKAKATMTFMAYLQNLHIVIVINWHTV